MISSPVRRISAAARLRIQLPESLSDDHRPWHAVVSSRLGRNPLLHHIELATVYRWVQQAVGDGAVPIVAPSTAAHPWVTRACRLLGVPATQLVLITNGTEKPAAGLRGSQSNASDGSNTVHKLSCEDATISADLVTVMLADRLDVAMVRRGGTIHRLVLQRLAEDNAPVVRVLVPVEPWGQPVLPGSARVIHELIDAGAVGYCCHWERRQTQPPANASAATSGPLAPWVASLLSMPQRWLVHCTRGRQGAWPGQSDEQFRDGLLLSVPEAADSSPLATLLRIVSQRQLIGSGRTVRCRRPVVCFSDLPILDVIQARAFRQHLGRWDAEPYGIIVDKQAAQTLGTMPVVYVDTAHKSKPMPHREPVPSGDQTTIEDWRLQGRGTTVDWTVQREWRSPGSLDLRKLSPHQLIVFVAKDSEIERFAAAPWPVTSIETLQRLSREGVATDAVFR